MTTRGRLHDGKTLLALAMLISGCDTYVAVSSGPGPTNGTDRPDGFGMDGSCSFVPDGGVNISQTDLNAPVDSPPIAGGTLLVTHDGHYAIASDPDRDMLYIVDRTDHSVRQITLQPGDEPGRLVEDANGTVHGVLRRAGAVVHINPATAMLLGRDTVCTTPRGIGYDIANHVLRVACADGHLLTLPTAGGAPTAITMVGDDLRDVVFDANGAMYVTQFRSAALLVAQNGTQAPTEVAFPSDPSRQRHIAWRTVAMPGGGAIVVHQFASTQPVDLGGCVSPYGGGGMTPGIVSTSVTYAPTGAVPQISDVENAPVPVDIAVSPDGTSIAIAAAGNGMRDGDDVVMLAVAPQGGALVRQDARRVTGTAVAVTYAPDSTLLIQTRTPATIIDGTHIVDLGGVRVPETGHAIFHAAASSGLACASCHPEATDDGHVWTFGQPFGAQALRRTQTFRGGFLATAPFHWDGTLTDMPALVGDVYVHRMGGSPLTGDESGALARWMDHLPLLTPPPADDAAAVERGHGLFNDPSVGCAACHAGGALTNNGSVDVGTGGTFQVPSLRGLRWRAPYMHNGCAATLADRFNPACGGGESHGHTAMLGDAQRSDLIAYLQTL